MRSLLILTLFLLASRTGSNEISRLLVDDAINALQKGLRFMEDEVAFLNVDGAVGVQFAKTILDSFARHRPEVLDGLYLRNALASLTSQASKVISLANNYLRFTQPEYYSDFGRIVSEGVVDLWHPSRKTDIALVVEPVPCSEADIDWPQSNQCLTEVIGRMYKPENCNVTKRCIEYMTSPKQRGYYITHQVIYFILTQMKNCTGKSEMLSDIPPRLLDSLCSNIKQQAEEIAELDYPVSQQDLFLEQIGVCGMLGFEDFYQKEWLIKIIEWQSESGCYENTDDWVCTGGCLSHKTTVALFALAAHIRFSMEKVYDSLHSSNRCQKPQASAWFVFISLIVALLIHKLHK